MKPYTACVPDAHGMRKAHVACVPLVTLPLIHKSVAPDVAPIDNV